MQIRIINDRPSLDAAALRVSSAETSCSGFSGETFDQRAAVKEVDGHLNVAPPELSLKEAGRLFRLVRSPLRDHQTGYR
jgi:hypothetical protein